MNTITPDILEIERQRREHRKKEYGAIQNIHRWLYSHYGRPKVCEDKNCKGKSRWFDWAVKRGMPYERNRDNFLRLCRSCHRRYDGVIPPAFKDKHHTPEVIEVIRQATFRQARNERGRLVAQSKEGIKRLINPENV